MCGFRVYPLAAIMELDRAQKLGARMSFDVEVLVRLHWAGMRNHQPVHRGELP
jgi:hypothetical protein